ncbi:MAG: glycosyltransferase family 9 protein [Chlorobium phaeovibrioides]|nr:glycosyltransferase family 9 protein [Chlorobium phaeovibrioides]
MEIVRYDSSPPDDDCPFASKKSESGSKKQSILQRQLKRIVFRHLSGRPLRTRPPIPENPRCVAVATGGNLGGAIISIPLIRGVRHKWPHAHLVVIGNRQHGIEIIQRAGLGDTYLVAPDTPLVRALMGDTVARQFKEQVLALKPDLFVGNFNLQCAHLLPLTQIPCTIGQGLATPSNLDTELFDYFVNYDFSSENWLEGYWRILKLLSVDRQEVPSINANAGLGSAFLRGLCDENDQQNAIYVGVQAATWASEAWKAWPTEKMTELCMRLLADKRYHIVIFGSEGQNELYNSIKERVLRHGRVINAVGKLSIAQLPDAVAACSAIISNDSGLMHLSAAVGTPTIALWGMTDYHISWVYGDNSRHALIRRPQVVPCYHHVNDVKKYCSSRDCIKNISIEAVHSTLLSILL